MYTYLTVKYWNFNKCRCYQFSTCIHWLLSTYIPHLLNSHVYCNMYNNLPLSDMKIICPTGCPTPALRMLPQPRPRADNLIFIKYSTIGSVLTRFAADAIVAVAFLCIHWRKPRKSEAFGDRTFAATGSPRRHAAPRAKWPDVLFPAVKVNSTFFCTAPVPRYGSSCVRYFDEEEHRPAGGIAIWISRESRG